ncbi:MAG: YjjG family noncanonical pyrimidine nucleotidase [Paramuribaculum sp.]|nr:YjjG family noncanonical pyrimidine nucleotidase [Paramuribaculum sp.]
MNISEPPIIIDTNKISIVWLDLDDTLIDFQANSLRALEKVYHLQQLSCYFASPQEWIERYHHYNSLLWKDYAPGRITREYLKMERFRMPLMEAGASLDKATALSEILDPVYLSLLGEEKQLVPGARDLLVKIKNAGLPIGILSNGFVEVQHKKIASAGMKDMIDIVVLSDDIGVNKPDVRLFQHAMKVSKEMHPERHLMIGDNPDTDIAGAIAAGWQAIHFIPNSSVNPSLLCSSTGELDRILIK